MADAALAHAKSSWVRVAYFRETLFGRRILLMDAWGAYLEEGAPGSG